MPHPSAFHGLDSHTYHFKNNLSPFRLIEHPSLRSSMVAPRGDKFMHPSNVRVPSNAERYSRCGCYDPATFSCSNQSVSILISCAYVVVVFPTRQLDYMYALIAAYSAAELILFCYSLGYWRRFENCFSISCSLCWLDDTEVLCTIFWLMSVDKIFLHAQVSVSRKYLYQVRSIRIN
jgi:hypothetical protein